jgi:cation diffusion facilitator CzcD-associated flavoprotein CzcO
VHSATFDEVEDRWVLEVGDGERVTGTHCIMATGCLSSANMPEFAGIDTFQGETYHTGHWPHDLLNGRWVPTFLAHAPRKSGSHMTQRWREVDSNSRSR